MSDGLLEIVGVTGVPHLGQIKAGIRDAIPIAQGRHIEILSYTRLPMQMDGEPWIQSPCKIDLSLGYKRKIRLPDLPSRNDTE